MGKIKSNLLKPLKKIQYKKSFKNRNKNTFDLKSSALSLQKARNKKCSARFKVTSNIRKTLTTQYKIKHNFDAIHTFKYKDNLPMARYVLCTDKKLLIIMNHGTKLSLSGLYNLEVICGGINILGYDISSNGTQYTVFSNELDGIMDITCTSGVRWSPKVKIILAENEVNPSIYTNLQNIYQREVFSIILIKKNISVLSKINEILRLSLYYQTMQSGSLPLSAIQFHSITNVRPLLKDVDNIGILKIPMNWKSCADNLLKRLNNKELCIMVCGGVNTGKSTLVRYLCNRLLSSENISAVACLDIDPVKPEFSAPGTLSLCVFSMPVLGPASLNYGNMKFLSKKEIMLPHSAPFDCLSEYYAIVKALREASKELNVPIIVNTMGHKYSLLEITVNLIQIIKPSQVIEMNRKTDNNSFDTKLNFPMLKALFRYSLYKHHELSAYILNDKPFAISEEEFKKHNLLSCILPNQKVTYIKSVEISYTNLAVHTLIPDLEPTFHLIACRMKLVALCEVDENHIIKTDKNLSNYISSTSLWSPTAKFHGYGFLLKANTHTKTLTLLISNKMKLISVNALVAVAFPLPRGFRSSLYKKFYIPDRSMKKTHNYFIERGFDGLSISVEEYNLVERLISSNIIEDLKKALQYIYIWKSRASNIPIGIDLMISLLKAWISLQDPMLDMVYKNICFHGDICRFINILCKSYNEDMLDDEPTIAKITSLIGVCPIMSEFRNLMSHYTPYVDLEISKRLTWNAMQWTKENYWDKLITKSNRRVLMKSNEASEIGSTECNPTKISEKEKDIPLNNDSKSEVTAGEFVSAGLIKTSINLYFCVLNVNRPPVSTNVNYRYDGFMLLIMKKYVHHRNEVMNLIVEEIFLHAERDYYIKKDLVRACACDNMILPKVLAHMKPVFIAFASVGNNVSNHFLETFLAKSTGNKNQFKKWFQLFIYNIKKKISCRHHQSLEINLFCKSVDWRSITICLMRNPLKMELQLAKKVISEVGEKMDDNEELLKLITLIEQRNN